MFKEIQCPHATPVHQRQRLDMQGSARTVQQYPQNGITQSDREGYRSLQLTGTTEWDSPIRPGEEEPERQFTSAIAEDGD